MNTQLPQQIFYLKSIAGLLTGFIPPPTPLDPAGAWKQTWRIYTLAGAGNLSGSITLARTPQPDGRVRLEVSTRYLLEAQCTMQIQAQVTCQADRFATPLDFEMICRTHTAKGQAVAGTELRKSGALRDGKWVVGRRALPLGGAYALNWGLFDAVQRLPRALPDPMRFDLIKDFDELKPAQTLSWRESLGVALGGAVLDLEAWQLTGEGTLPTIYYRDTQGRLLFVISGLEGYILDSFRPAQGAAQ